jgi:hypothetical protein
MVELFAAGRLTRTPELVTPAALVAACGLPTEAKLNEPGGPDPLDGIQLCKSLSHNYTRFSQAEEGRHVAGSVDPCNGVLEHFGAGGEGRSL